MYKGVKKRPATRADLDYIQEFMLKLEAKKKIKSKIIEEVRHEL